MSSFTETLYPFYGQTFGKAQVLHLQSTDQQVIEVFENRLLGHVMTIDGIVQTTEKDEFIYHEMLTHVPLFAHPNPKKVLIIGGGDGGILREVLKHKTVEQVTLVEIDQEVINIAKTYFPNHSNGAFDDPRARIIIDDGVKFVNETSEKFDVVISDSTDPYGAAESLFGSDFYTAIRNCLSEKGVFVAQNGVPFYQIDELKDTAERFAPLFNSRTFFTAAVPTYVGGIMAFAWGSNTPSLLKVSLEELIASYEESGIETRYYTPEMHLASFALPKYLLDAIIHQQQCR
jgi:spermidine synthase